MPAAAATAETLIYPKRWIKLEAYCALTGETKNAVETRVAKGQWVRGVHVKVKSRRLWVNLPEADRWVESG